MTTQSKEKEPAQFSLYKFHPLVPHALPWHAVSKSLEEAQRDLAKAANDDRYLTAEPFSVSLTLWPHLF